MRKTRRRIGYVSLVLCVVVALGLAGWSLAGCGGTTKKSSGTSTTKLPPGATETQTSAASSTDSSTTAQSTAATSAQSTTATAAQTTTSTPSTAADLTGAHFTVVGATRLTTDKSVISSSQREVPGDYLQVELTIQNTGAYGLIDLLQYSFRLQSPGIAADTYSNYYGTTGTYGAYVSTHVISATLMDLTELQAVSYKVKVGETVSKVIVFFDLNPETNAKNTAVTKDNTQLIIYKASGTDYGTKVAIPLTGYPD